MASFKPTQLPGECEQTHFMLTTITCTVSIAGQNIGFKKVQGHGEPAMKSSEID